MSKKESDKITNFYEILKRKKNKYLDVEYNPNFDKHHIKIEFRMLICGQSGSGKTNVAMELLKRFSGTFELVIICTKNPDEPLYNYLRDKTKEGLIFYEGGDVPPLDELDRDLQKLIIFDDLVNEKDQRAIEDYFLRGRKLKTSSIYISQSYFKVPKFIRLNVNYIILKKIGSKRDLKLILSEYNLDISIDDLLALYQYATQDKFDFFMIDIDAPAGQQFRKNFLELI